MMETIELQIFKFSELSEEAKSKAINWANYKNIFYGAWQDESLDSIRTFCEHFGAKLKDWSVGPFSPYYYKTTAENENFRGLKLARFNREFMPTGYCLDCALWQSFHDEFKKTGSAKLAFNRALDCGFREWREDMEWQCSEEYIGENLEINDYRFFENGEVFKG